MPESTKTKPAAPEKWPYHKGSSQQQEYIDYAWDISHDANFIYLLKAENGEITPDRKSDINYYCPKTKTYKWDYGLCQISDCYYPQIVNEKKFFTDWKWQLNQCYNLYKGGVTFYGIRNIPNVKKYFEWK